MNISFPCVFGKKKPEEAHELTETTYRNGEFMITHFSKSAYSYASQNNDRAAEPPLPKRQQDLLHAPVPLYLPPTDTTLQYIRERNWEAALHRLAVCPADAQYSESPTTAMSLASADTLLHTACLYRAPNELIERLLILGNPDTVWTRNSQGWIPLHIHITYSTTPCPALIQAGGARAIRMKWHGGTALHLACRHATTSPQDLMQRLVRLAPDCVCIPTHANGVYPAELIFRKPSFGGTVGQWESLWILVAAWKEFTSMGENKKKQQFPHQEELCDLIAFQADCCSPQSNVCVVSLYLDLAQPISISREAKRLAAKVSTPRVILRLYQATSEIDEQALRCWLERRDLLNLTPSVRLEVLDILSKSLDVSGWWNLAQTLDDMYFLLRSAPHGVVIRRFAM